MRLGMFAPAGEPAPAAVGKLHFGEVLHSRLHHAGDLGIVEDRILLEPLPTGGSHGRVAELLGIEIGPFLLDLRQVEVHPLENALHDDRRQEPIECAICRVVRIADEIGQRVDERGRQAGRITDFQERIVHPPPFGDRDLERGRVFVRTDRAGIGLGFEHAVHADGEMHLDRVGLFVGERLHADDGLALCRRLHPPIDPRLAAGRHFDGLFARVERRERLAVELDYGPHALRRFRRLCTMAERTTSSVSTKNRGASIRTADSWW